MSERTKKQSLKILNGYFLKDTKFILSSEISIADLQALCELTQSWTLGEPLEAEYPNMDRWVADCKDQLGTHFDAVHKFVYFARDSNFFGSSKLWPGVDSLAFTYHHSSDSLETIHNIALVYLIMFYTM